MVCRSDGIGNTSTEAFTGVYSTVGGCFQGFGGSDAASHFTPSHEWRSLRSLGQSAVSHQLRILRDARLVQFRREGKNVQYSLADAHVFTLLNVGLEHVAE